MKYFGIRELIPCVDGHCVCDAQLRVKNEQLIVRVPSEVIENAIALVENVLDPLREEYGHPIRVNSGYRCPLKNKAVGGVMRSQHLRGEAADITGGSPEENLNIARILVENGRYDQCILYVDSASSLAPRFIHVSHKRLGGNRGRILKQVRGRKDYLPVKSEELIVKS